MVRKRCTKKELLGKAPSEKGQDLTETEAAIEGMIDMIGKPKALFQPVLERYGQISTGDTITEEDVELFIQKAKNQLVALKTTDAKTFHQKIKQIWILITCC